MNVTEYTSRRGRVIRFFHITKETVSMQVKGDTSTAHVLFSRKDAERMKRKLREAGMTCTRDARFQPKPPPRPAPSAWGVRATKA